MHEVIKSITGFLQKPFKENLAFFLKIWLLISAADMFFWSIHGNILFGGYMGAHGFVYAYIVDCLYGLLGPRAKKVYQVILITLGLVNFIADSFAHYIMHSGFTIDIVAIIRGTNASEGTEFMSLYMKPDIIAFILLCIAFLPVIDWIVKKIDVDERRRWCTALLSLLLLFFVTYIGIRRSKNWETVFLHKILAFTSYNPPEDLTPYRSTPSIQSNGDSPQIIAFIIGESLSRNHCSMYGYEKTTTPYLSQMVSDSLIYAYENISAAYYHTGGAFPRIMSTYSGMDEDVESWHKSVFLEDVTATMGYCSFWISNQSSSGICDNPIARIAELSDSLIWVGTKGLGIQKDDFDQEIIPPVRNILDDSHEEKTFFIIHLMGQHEAFSKRYPEEFKRYGAQDYLNLPRNQRQVMADYDNAVLYGDWVVSELMKAFSEKEAIVFFFPDHALDIFDSDPSYVGHARPVNTKSIQAGLQIPFLIYTTKKYREHFPDKCSLLLNATERLYNTEDLIYTVMDLGNASFTDNPSLVKEKSLLSE